MFFISVRLVVDHRGKIDCIFDLLGYRVWSYSGGVVSGDVMTYFGTVWVEIERFFVGGGALGRVEWCCVCSRELVHALAT